MRMCEARRELGDTLEGGMEMGQRPEGRKRTKETREQGKERR